MARRQLGWGFLALVFAAVVASAWLVKHQQSAAVRERLEPQQKTSIPDAIRRSFELVEQRQDRFSHRSTLTRKDQVLHLETIAELDAESAATVIHEGVIGIEALYANALSDYPGDLSQKVTTPPRFRPVLSRAPLGQVPRAYFLLYATERLTFGAVSEDTAKRRALLGWIYCESERALYRVELFTSLTTPPNALEDYFLALSCR